MRGWLKQARKEAGLTCEKAAELLGEYGEIDSVRLDEICEAMSHGYEETE